MTRLSREERKRLRRAAEESIRQQDVFVTVISPRATTDAAGPALVVAEAAKVGVCLGHLRIDDSTYAFGVPGELDTLHVVVGYGVVDEDFLSLTKLPERLDSDQHRFAIGTPAITLRGKVRLDQAIDFVGMTVLRVLGRLTHGVLTDDSSHSINDDWLCWSLDYMDPDMFNVTRIYDDPSPDYRSLAKRFPQLRASCEANAGKRRPWWRFW
jgi:hypothetical protein